ncbi:MAG: dihydroneopterin aldolase [Actinobacteria bacterium]|jgi:dihydroneopterin aldolase|nr:dihydroneopterin aldolase [Actinomycetota bacterium]
MNDDSTDLIEVNQLEVIATHGVLPEERVKSQRFEVDLKLWIQSAAGTRRDDLADTVDYAGVITRVVEAMTSERSYYLLEALAEAVLESIFEFDTRVSSVEIAVRKMDPPVQARVGSVGVRCHRSRDWSDARRRNRSER